MKPSNKTLRLESVRVVWEPDTDWIADPDEHANPEDCERCQAIATVSYQITRDGDRRLETLTSGGLNGIEGAEGDYRRQIEGEELSDLREHLRVFGVPVGDFARIANRPDLQE